MQDKALDDLRDYIDWRQWEYSAPPNAVYNHVYVVLFLWLSEQWLHL